MEREDYTKGKSCKKTYPEHRYTFAEIESYEKCAMCFSVRTFKA